MALLVGEHVGEGSAGPATRLPTTIPVQRCQVSHLVPGPAGPGLPIVCAGANATAHVSSIADRARCGLVGGGPAGKVDVSSLTLRELSRRVRVAADLRRGNG